MTEQHSFVAGISIPQRSEDAASLLQLSRTDGYDFVVTDLPSTVAAGPLSPTGGSVRKDVTSLESKWWSTSIVGAVPDSPPFDDSMQSEDGAAAWSEGSGLGSKLVAALASPDHRAQASAEANLKSMVEWASHMSIPAVILPPIPTNNHAAALAYARVLSSIALQCSATNVQLWIRTPLTPAAIEAFDLLHRRCDGPSNLGVLLCFHTQLEPAQAGLSMVLIHQSVGNNLKALSFVTSTFLTNKRGYPTLSKSHQIIFTELLRRLGRTLRVLVEGTPMHHPPTADANGLTGCLAYLQYLRHLRSRQEVAQILDTEESLLETSYLDHLQSPLQPLGDNLEFQTYETFERDPVKYQRYKLAIELALRDGIALQKYPRVDEHGCYGVNFLVVGAGRGPLIRAVLGAVSTINGEGNSSEGTGGSGSAQQPTVRPKIIAIEKNPAAVLYLHSLQNREPSWSNVVTVVECDMRRATSHPVLRGMISNAPARADIVVSELLGSFGDNELSPECLDGVQKCGVLKDDCISIPQSYTSFLAPVSSMRLHSEARAQAYSPSNPTDGPGGQPCGTLRALETPYVVRPHAASQTHVEKACWDFRHPKVAGDSSSTSENGGSKSEVSAMSTTSAGNINGSQSVEAVILEPDNERHIRVSFPHDQTHGAGSGCGYGPFDSAVAAMAAAMPIPPVTSSSGSSSSVSQSGFSGATGMTVHGFLGTFHSTLYQSPLPGNEGSNSVISIAPTTFSVGMFSWFPVYFPLREALHVPSGASVVCSMWRKADNGGGDVGSGGRVWYEWCAEIVGEDDRVIGASHLHNPGGRSYHVRL
uniref:Protein arginine N-methyltransferase n=1 Tax=Helicotheca tamesis TaxID=374047 RepID=A0A7S2E2A0_9STRA|mmetsp:Transcript_11715/g.16239  ORF Transcript_11715/g.16239 Transcript_11715/m.16239 type:complete len:816 (+) Transcript_11715:120-2567(+)